jgi:hypothetical protein
MPYEHNGRFAKIIRRDFPGPLEAECKNNKLIDVILLDFLHTTGTKSKQR